MDPIKDYQQLIDRGASLDYIAQCEDYKTKRDESIKTTKPYEVVISPSRASFFLDMGSDVRIFHGECHRNAFLTRKGFPVTDNPNPISIRKMRIGQLFEAQEHIYEERVGILKHKNFRMNKEISKEVLLSCEVDSIVELSDGKWYIIEDKSYDGYYQIKHIEGNKSRQGMPKYDHIAQNMFYLAIAKETLPEDKFTGTTIFHYRTRSEMHPKFHTLQLESSVDSNGNTIDAYPVVNGVKHSFVTLRTLIARGLQLAKYIVENTLPPRDPQYAYSEESIRYLLSMDEVSKAAYKRWQEEGENIGDWQCNHKYCRYFHLCMGATPNNPESLPSDDMIMSKLGHHVVDRVDDENSSLWG